MKFLAVLAVLAMAFAVFAVVAPADESDAAHGTATTATLGTGATDVLVYTDGMKIENAKAYYFAKNATVSVEEDSAVMFFIAKGVTVTATATDKADAQYVYAYLGLVNVTSATATTITFSECGFDSSAWNKYNGYTVPSEARVSGSAHDIPANGWGQKVINFQHADGPVGIIANSSGTGFSYVSGPDTDVDVHGDISLIGAFGIVDVKVEAATLTLKNFTATLKTGGEETASLEDFTGTATLASTKWTFIAGAYTGDHASGYTVTQVSSGSITIDSKLFTFFDFAGAITTNHTTIGSLQYYHPAIQISGTDQSSDEKVAISATIEGRISVTSLVETPSNTISTNTEYIATEGASFYIEKKATIDIGVGVVFVGKKGTSDITNQGKLRISGIYTNDDYAQLVNDGTVFVLEDTAIIPAVIKGTGSVNTEAILVDGYLAEEYKGSAANAAYTPTVFPMGQRIIAAQNVTLKDNAKLIIHGTLVINEGVTIEIEKGSQLIIIDSTAKIINNGRILNESMVKFTSAGVQRIDGTTENSLEGGIVLMDAYLENNGTINGDYTPSSIDAYKVSAWVQSAYNVTTARYATINLSGNAVNNGIIAVGDDDSLYTGYGIFENNGTIDVRGVLYLDSGNTGAYPTATTYSEAVFANSGTLNLYGYVMAEGNNGTAAAIFLMSKDAKVVINELKFLASSGVDKLSVSDANFKTRTSADKPSVVTFDAYHFSSATYTSNAETLSGVTVGLKTLTYWGATKASTGKVYTELTLVGVASAATVADQTSAWEAEIKIKGEIETAGSLTLTENVKLTMDGTSGNTYTISGVVTAAQSANYGLFFTGVNDTLTVTGKFTAVRSDIALNGATVNAAKYKVLSTETTPTKYVYTTLGTAIADEATSITLYGSNAVADDLTIPAGTTVVNNSSATLTVNAEKTLAVAEGGKLKNDGTIDVKGTLIANDYKNTLKGEGTILADVERIGNGIATYTNLETALNTAVAGDTVTVTRDDAISKSVDIHIPAGVVLDIQDVVLTMEENTVITIDGTLAIGSVGKLTLTEADEGSDDVDAKAVLHGFIIKEDGFPSAGYKDKIGGAYYEMTVKGIIYGFATPVSNVPTVIDDADDGLFDVYGETTVGTLSLLATESAKMNFHGDLTATTITLDNTTLVFDTGVVVVAGFSNIDGAVAVKGEAGADFSVYDSKDKLYLKGKFVDNTDKKYVTTTGNVYSAGFSATKLTVEGVYDVTANNATAIGELLVKGSVVIDNDKNLKVTTASVLGTVTSAAKTETAGNGNFIVETLWVGLTDNTAVENAAAVAGKVTLGSVAFVLNGATVPESILELPSTEYYIEGKLWLTAYAVGNVSILSVGEAPIENADFVCWMDGTELIALDDYIGQITRADAYFDYEIYNVTIRSDAGIKEVSIGGKIMKSPLSGENEFTLENLTAGTYKVSYTLINGYEGSAQLYTADGTILKDNSFVLSGTDDRNIVLQLIGTEQIVTPEPSPVEQNEWTITTILLVILVILIAIMAVIVALRLNRS